MQEPRSYTRVLSAYLRWSHNILRIPLYILEMKDTLCSKTCGVRVLGV